jgi:hypothetical protein
VDARRLFRRIIPRETGRDSKGALGERRQISRRRVSDVLDERERQPCSACVGRILVGDVLKGIGHDEGTGSHDFSLRGNVCLSLGLLKRAEGDQGADDNKSQGGGRKPVLSGPARWTSRHIPQNDQNKESQVRQQPTADPSPSL